MARGSTDSARGVLGVKERKGFNAKICVTKCHKMSHKCNPRIVTLFDLCDAKCVHYRDPSRIIIQRYFASLFADCATHAQVLLYA